MSGRDSSTVGQTHPPDLPPFSSWSRQSAVSWRDLEKRIVLGRQFGPDGRKGGRPAELPFRESAFAKKAKSVIFLLPDDEGADRRKPACGDRGPGDCPPAQPDSAARRSARHHGAEWLRQEHACKGARRSS